MRYSLYFKNKNAQTDGYNYLNLLFLDDDFDYDELTNEEFAEYSGIDRDEVDKYGNDVLSNDESMEIVDQFAEAISELGINLEEYEIVIGYAIEDTDGEGEESGSDNKDSSE